MKINQMKWGEIEENFTLWNTFTCIGSGDLKSFFQERIHNLFSILDGFAVLYFLSEACSCRQNILLECKKEVLINKINGQVLQRRPKT